MFTQVRVAIMQGATMYIVAKKRKEGSVSGCTRAMEAINTNPTKA